MNANCDACARGPSNVDGHAGLMVQSLGSTGMVFKCRVCALTWMRSYSGDGHYGWTRLADRTPATAWFGFIMPPARPRPATAEVVDHARPATPRPAAAEVAAPGGAALDQWLSIQQVLKQPPHRPN